MYRVNNRKHLTQVEKGSIITLTNIGKSIREISNQIGCSDGTVVNWQRRFALMGNVDRLQGTGRRNKITTAGQDYRLFRCVQDNPITTGDDIASKYSSTMHSFNFLRCDLYLLL